MNKEEVQKNNEPVLESIIITKNNPEKKIKSKTLLENQIVLKQNRLKRKAKSEQKK